MIPLIIFLIAQSNGDYLTPEQLRISFTNSSGEIRVTWVLYSPIPNYLYYRELLCESSSEYQSVQSTSYIFNQGSWMVKYQFIHTAIIKVNASCEYEYYTGSWLGWSPVYKISGRTPNNSDLDLTNILLIADWGTGNFGQNTNKFLKKYVKSKKFDAILHGGDFAYSLETVNGLIGDAWFKMIQPLAATVPYMAIPGNHENSNNASHFKNRFIMPYNEANQGSGYFFSFNLGRGHFVMINTEIYVDDQFYLEALTQNNWIKEDLEKANKERDVRPWIIFSTHRGLYCSIDGNLKKGKNNDCGEDAMFLRQNLEEILNEYKVDLFMQAHVHQYQRNYPIYKNERKIGGMIDSHTFRFPRAPIYITNGNAGNWEEHNDPMLKEGVRWSIYNTEEYGFGRVEVNLTHLYYEQISSVNETVIDYLWIIKD